MRHGGRQFLLLLKRDSVKWLRGLPAKGLDFISIAVIAAVLGLVKRGDFTDLKGVQSICSIAYMFVGVLSAVWATQVITRELRMAQREAGGSISVLALFASLTGLNSCVDVLMRALMFSVLYHPIIGFQMPWADLFLGTFGVAWSCSGIGYFSACAIPEHTAMVFSVAFTFLLGGVLNGLKPTMADIQLSGNEVYRYLIWPSYNRWATEAMTVKEYEYTGTPGSKLVQISTLQIEIGYDPANYVSGVLFLFISGLVLRLVALAFFSLRMKA